MNVTLSQLRTFERIVRLGSFRAAAQELRLAQPSVSLRIRELESVLRHSSSSAAARGSASPPKVTRWSNTPIACLAPRARWSSVSRRATR